MPKPVDMKRKQFEAPIDVYRHMMQYLKWTHMEDGYEHLSPYSVKGRFNKGELTESGLIWFAVWLDIDSANPHARVSAANAIDYAKHIVDWYERKHCLALHDIMEYEVSRQFQELDYWGREETRDDRGFVKYHWTKHTDYVGGTRIQFEYPGYKGGKQQCS